MYAPLDLDAQLAAIASRLAERQDDILARWRRDVGGDARIGAADSLSRAQFVDHIPEVLAALHRALACGRRGAVSAAAANAEQGGRHGAHRWQQGYSLIELMREWSHLQLALVAEVERMNEEQPGLDVRAIHTAYRAISVLCLEGMSESAEQFERMQRTEAAGQVSDIGLSLAAVRALERRQADILRSAAHDLRGNLGIVSSATTALNLEELSGERRAELFAMAQRAIGTHTRLLADLMDLARLQAGYERRNLALTDIAPVLRELCELAQPVATERRLYLHCDGPPQLTVETDAVKLGRIVQNLLLNALHYTERGGVTVTWAGDDGGQRWTLAVVDTGPGIEAVAAAPLVGALSEATSGSAPDGAERATDDAGAAEEAAAASSAVAPRHGEGIGLSIVKRLCELLDATLELHSEAGAGTTFRIGFPRRYARD
jgi:signal transduction histidine kinase